MKTFVVETFYYQPPFLLLELLRYLRASLQCHAVLLCNGLHQPCYVSWQLCLFRETTSEICTVCALHKLQLS